MAEHGTYARYKKHTREKDTPCDECREACRVYQNELFARHPQTHEAEKLRQRAVQRAATRLKHMYPLDYEVFYQDELRKEQERERPAE